MRHARRILSPIVLGFGLVLLTGLALPLAAAPTPVTCGAVITTPGDYFLSGDCTAAGTGITINASDVQLSLAGHTISGADVGVDVISGSNNKVQGGTILGGGIGVRLFGSSNVATNLTVSGSQLAIGVYGDQNVASANTVSNTNTGIAAISSTNAVIRGNSLTGSFWGIAIGGTGVGGAGLATDTQVKENTIHPDPGNCAGIILTVSGATGTLVQDNSVSTGTACAAGILVAAPNTNNNIRSNVVTNNLNVGIFIEGTNNQIQKNSATGNGSDLQDTHSDCDSNHWLQNIFTTSNQSCIH